MELEEQKDISTDKQASEVFELKWENPPGIKDLQKDFQGAKEEHDEQVNRVNRWLDYRNITGEAHVPKSKTRSSVVPKTIRKQNEWRYASLTEPFLSTDELITAKPITAEDVEGARQASLVLNKQFNTDLDRVSFFDEYARTCVDEGTVMVRVGWEYEVDKVITPTPVPVLDNVRAAAMINAGHEPFDVEMKEEEKIVVNRPTADIVPYTNYYVDPTCMGDIDKAQFVIVSTDTTLAELKKSAIDYKNLDQIQYQGGTDGDADHNPDDTDTSFTFNDNPRKKLVAYEYWGYWDVDGDDTLTPIVATWVGNTLIRMEENPYPDKKLPFVMVQYMPVRNHLFGEPDAELLIDNQKIIGATTRGMVDIMARVANGQEGSRKGALDAVNKARKARGEDYEYNDGSPAEIFHMGKFPEIPQSAPMMISMQNAEAESLTGIKAFSSGISGKSLGEQGVGIKSALDATSKREVAIQRRLANGVIKIARKFLSMNSEFLEDDEVVRITNDEFVPIKRDDLSGKIDITLSISTPEADNEKAQELAFMLQTSAASQDPAESRMIRAEIARLRNMPALAKQIEEFQPPPPTPEQIQMQQLAMRKEEAEILKIEAEAQEAMAKAQELMAKVNTEGAKAREYEAKADKVDLDYVEQETGTAHARDIDKITQKPTTTGTNK